MSNNPRDTQFKAFAKLLMDEMLGEAGYIDVTKNCDIDEIDEFEQLIARRAYDLVEHAMKNPQAALSVEEMVSLVPDMTEWPDRGADGSE